MKRCEVHGTELTCLTGFGRLTQGGGNGPLRDRDLESHQIRARPHYWQRFGDQGQAEKSRRQDAGYAAAREDAAGLSQAGRGQ
jgi:hypothetical protein